MASAVPRTAARIAKAGTLVGFLLLLAAVIGAGTPAVPATPSSCWPAWEQRDLELAASLRLPVFTRVVRGQLGNLHVRVTTPSLPAWLGEPHGTLPTVAALLRGFSVRGLFAVSPDTVLQLIPGRTTVDLLVEERHLTPFQRRATGLVHYPGAVTLDLNYLPPEEEVSNLRQGLAALIAATASPSSLPVGLYTTDVLFPPPTHYLSAAGPLNPGRWLKDARSPSSGFVCQAAFLHVMGLRAGYLRPVPLHAAMLANGVAFGFAPGFIVVDNLRPGYHQSDWYRDPAITAPSGP
jgi:hypothetical protein